MLDYTQIEFVANQGTWNERQRTLPWAYKQYPLTTVAHGETTAVDDKPIKLTALPAQAQLSQQVGFLTPYPIGAQTFSVLF